MTHDEIMWMKPGRELDKLVDNIVMNRYSTTGRHGEWIYPAPRSRNIAAAWEVAEQLQKQGYVVCIELLPYEETSVGVYEADPANQIAYAKAQTPAEAICKAALLAVMDGEDEHERD